MNYNRKRFFIFFDYYRPHLKLVFADMICVLLVSAIDVAFPMITKYALDSIVPQKSVHLFMLFISALTAIYFLRREFTWLENYWGRLLGNLVESDMRRDAFSHIEEQSFSFFDTHRTGKIMSRVTTDLFEVTDLVYHGAEDFLVSILTLLGSFFMLMKIRFELSAVVFAFVTAMIIAALVSRKNLSKSSRKVKEATSDLISALESSISGVRVTKGFTNEDYEKARFENASQEYCIKNKQFFKDFSSFQANVEFFDNMLSVLVLFIGGIFIIKGKLLISDLVAANLFIAAFSRPVRRLAKFAERYSTGMAGFDRFTEIMRTDTSIKGGNDALDAHSVKGNIDFCNVSFSYPEGLSVLSGVNLHIKAGEKFALVGASGAGKTTLCSLIPRFYELSSGRILLDGQDIKSLDIKSLRNSIGIVEQDVFLFAGTVRENIAYGKIGATDDEIRKAAMRAEIHDDIMNMPYGYNTIVGERGIKLSGGQKQRVSIARCFLKNPPILILDEATSSLDTETEVKIQSAFDSLSKGRTTLVIAHRLSTIKNANTIAVIDKNSIAEIGTHEYLIKKRGLYYGLYKAVLPQ